MDTLQSLQVIDNATSGIAQTYENRKGEELLMGLKAGTVDPDKVGSRPYEQKALQDWEAADIEKYKNKYAGMSHDQIQDVDPDQEEHPLHANLGYTEVMKAIKGREDVQTAVSAARTQNAMVKYKAFVDAQSQFNRYMVAGDKNMAGALVTQVIDGSSMPVKAQYDSKTGMVKLFQSDPDNPGAPLELYQSIPIDEFGKKFNQIGKKQFVSADVMYSAAAADRNINAVPKEYINPDTGEVIKGKYIVNPLNLSDVKFQAFKRGSGKLLPIKDEDTLYGMGFIDKSQHDASRQAGLKIQKTVAEIGKIQAQTGEAGAKAFKAKEEGLAAARGEGKGAAKFAGRKEKIATDELKASAKKELGADKIVWTSEDVMEHEAKAAKEIADADDPEKAKEEANLRTYGAKDPTLPGSFKLLKNPQTGVKGRYYEKTGLFIIDGIDPPQAIRQSVSKDVTTDQDKRQGLIRQKIQGK